MHAGPAPVTHIKMSIHPYVSTLLEYVRQQSGGNFELFITKCASFRMRMAVGLFVRCEFADQVLYALVNEARSWQDVFVPEQAASPSRLLSTAEMLVSVWARDLVCGARDPVCVRVTRCACA